MTTGTEDHVASEVRALVADLLPVLAPHAMLDADTGLLVLPVGTAHADISLDAITANCAQLPPHAWPRQVGAWLADKTAQVTAALEERKRLGRIERLLRAQVVPRLPESERQRLMCTPYGELLDVVVTLDHPEGGPLTRERAGRLAVDDLGDHAMTNTLRVELPTLTAADQTLNGEHSIRVISHPRSPYVTSALLDLERFLPGPCPYGVLIALPGYNEVLLHPVQPDSLRSAAQDLADRARDAYGQSRLPYTDGLFWWAEGSLFAVDFGRFTHRVKVPAPLRHLLR